MIQVGSNSIRCQQKRNVAHQNKKKYAVFYKIASQTRNFRRSQFFDCFLNNRKKDRNVHSNKQTDS